MLPTMRYVCLCYLLEIFALQMENSRQHSYSISTRMRFFNTEFLRASSTVISLKVHSSNTTSPAIASFL